MSEKPNPASTLAAPSGDLPSLEFRIPISPTDSNMRMVRYFLESVRQFGGPIARAARCVLSIGDEAPPFDLRPHFPWIEDHRIDVHWVDADQFAKWRYDATGFDRFWIASDADVVAKIDADLLVAGDFDDMVLRAHREQIMLGAMAHVSPFGMRNLDGRPSAAWWADIYRAAGLAMPPLRFQYAAWGMDFDAMPHRRDNQVLATDPAHRYGPAYYNAGVVISPRRYLEQMGTTIVQDVELVRNAMDTIYTYQIAHPISFERHGIPHDSLSINYNFPLNLPGDALRALNPDAEGGTRHKDARIFHYIGRRKFFESPRMVRKLIKNDTLDGAWPVFQNRLRKIHKIINEPLD